MVAIGVDVLCVCVYVCVCIGNQESHLPQQIFPGDRWSQCTVITNMICACTELCCTWLICCATCLRVGLICVFLLYYNTSDGGRGEASRGASALMREEMMGFFPERTGAVSHHRARLAFRRTEDARSV